MKAMNKKQKNLLIRIIISGVLLLVLNLLPIKDKPYLRFALFLFPYFIAGYDILKKAFKGIRKKQVMDENFLMAVATVGAMILGEYTEGVAVMWFYQIGEFFQSYAVGKSRKNISDLMDIRPDYANILVDGKLEKADPEDVPTGSIIVVKPGEKVPIDGVILNGVSTVNTSALTGESLPRDIKQGDNVISGSVNLTGPIEVRTTKEFTDSTVSKILELVENAGARKAKSEKFITKFASVYTPIVCVSALVLAVLPPLILFILRQPPMWGEWVYRALTFLVISCPCAIVVSVPLSFFGGIGGAGSRGILIKGSNYMEAFANVKTVVFDKTGTVTKGSFEVLGVHHGTYADEKIIEYAALAECYSDHPISGSLKRVYGKEPDRNRVGDVKELSGYGVIAKVDDKEITAGNIKLMKRIGLDVEECHSSGTIVHIAIDGSYAGHILISDDLKPEANELVTELKKAGVKRLIMLTGDAEKAAKAVAAKVGITEVYAGLLPEGKVTLVEKFLKENGKNETLAFAGDGINDAPVLSRADIGIAMGALGSDAAIEAADIVLMDDNPLKIAKGIKIAKKCIRIVHENIIFAIGVKLLCLLLGAVGIANMWLAIFADVGVAVICILNAVRCLMVKRI